MSVKKYVSEEGINRILEKIALTILEKAETVEEAAQIVRAAKYAKVIEADVVTSNNNTDRSRLLEATINVPGVSPESVINAMEMLHSTPREYIICINEKGNRKVLSRHKDKDEAIVAGKAASRTITEEGQSISMISGNVSDDGVATGPIQFFELWE